ncbi:MAG: bifunctional hydroxymethylpyrimidine kinase/phosphomethylpyrimidine kinase [Acidobacteria bacterium]|nr:bifunctional hydroxymethylpyrimidine kinase/phosphomethylpyrimidine kinase [Acidobacteriota bacterium]
MKLQRILTIAGSDSGGGAGIQADLKTIAALGGYGMSVVTALTAQNTVGVLGIHDVPAEFIALQFEAIAADIGTDAAKTGMLATREVIHTVAEKIRHYDVPNLVVDPVMVAKSGARLIREDAQAALVSELLPLAAVVTPNIPEAETLAGLTIQSPADMQAAARRIYDLGPAAVYLKGGHLPGDALDLLYDGREFTEFRCPRIETRDTHGTGCTLSAAIATGLGQGLPLPQAVARAKDYITMAIDYALRLGAGHGPTNHFAFLLLEQRGHPFLRNLDLLAAGRASAFVEEAGDFDDWFRRNPAVFESELLAEKAFISDPEHTLSVGVGSGLFEERLGIRQGVEPAEGMAALARQRGVEVKIAGAEDLPYPDESFAAVLLGTILSYVPDRRQAIREARRVLKPGGAIVISYLPREGSYALMYDLAYRRGYHDPKTAPPAPYPLKFMAGVDWCSTDDIRQLLEENGFRNLEFVQTLTRHPRYTNEAVEPPVPGYDRGDYVVVSGRKS